MTAQIEIELRAEGEALPGAFLDPREIERMFASTRQSLRASLGRKLRGLRCQEHGAAPKLRVSGVYDRSTEAMELDYHIEACCQLFTVRVIKVLNRRV